MDKRLPHQFTSVFEPSLMQEIDNVGTYKTIPAGTNLIEPGTYLRAIPLVLSGSIKIIRVDKKGNEILMYFLHPGETCAVALSCCLGHTKSEIRAVAETPLEIVTIPVRYMEEWSSRFKSWRNFVMQTYHKQLIDAFTTIDIIAFSKLDERLKIYLRNKQKITQENGLKITHQEIANDLNSSRVVISRLLKKLEQENQIKLHHNWISFIEL